MTKLIVIQLQITDIYGHSITPFTDSTSLRILEFYNVQSWGSMGSARWQIWRSFLCKACSKCYTNWRFHSINNMKIFINYFFIFAGMYACVYH